MALRNRATLSLEVAETIEDPRSARAYLTFVFVGAGYAGLEGIAELQDFVADILDRYPKCRLTGTRCILVEAGERVMPEISRALAEFATRELRARGMEVRTGTTSSASTIAAQSSPRASDPDANARLDRRRQAIPGAARPGAAARLEGPRGGRRDDEGQGFRERLGDR